MSTDYRYQQQRPLRAGTGEDLPQSVPGTTTGPLPVTPRAAARVPPASHATGTTRPSRQPGAARAGPGSGVLSAGHRRSTRPPENRARRPGGDDEPGPGPG